MAVAFFFEAENFRTEIDLAVQLLSWALSNATFGGRAEEREFSIDNLLIRIHLIIEMTLVDRPCAMGV